MNYRGCLLSANMIPQQTSLALRCVGQVQTGGIWVIRLLKRRTHVQCIHFLRHLPTENPPNSQRVRQLLPPWYVWLHLQRCPQKQRRLSQFASLTGNSTAGSPAPIQCRNAHIAIAVLRVYTHLILPSVIRWFPSCLLAGNGAVIEFTLIDQLRQFSGNVGQPDINECKAVIKCVMQFSSLQISPVNTSSRSSVYQTEWVRVPVCTYTFFVSESDFHDWIGLIKGRHHPIAKSLGVHLHESVGLGFLPRTSLLCECAHRHCLIRPKCFVYPLPGFRWYRSTCVNIGDELVSQIECHCQGNMSVIN